MGACMLHYWYVEVLSTKVVIVKADSENDAWDKAAEMEGVNNVLKVLNEGDEC